VHTGFWWENISERDNLEDVSVDRIMILIYAVKKEDRGVLIGFFWLRIGTSGCTCENTVMKLRVP
jgi:hypothetical protein